MILGPSAKPLSVPTWFSGDRPHSTPTTRAMSAVPGHRAHNKAATLTMTGTYPVVGDATSLGRPQSTEPRHDLKRLCPWRLSLSPRLERGNAIGTTLAAPSAAGHARGPAGRTLCTEMGSKSFCDSPSAPLEISEERPAGSLGSVLEDTVHSC